MSFNKTKLALAVAAGLAVAPAAFATNGIIQAGNGMVAHGMGGAGLANAGEAAAGMDNPALISDTGDSLSMGFSMFSPDRSWDIPAAGLEFKSDNNMYAIPQIAYTSKINSGMSWGIMAYAMGGMDTSYRVGLMSATPESVDLSGMIVAPTMSFGLGKNATLGASLLIGWENFRVQNIFGMAMTDEGSTMAYGVKLGGDFKVADGIAVGVIVQPKMSAGEFSFFKNLLTGFGFTGDAALVLPNEFGVGGKFAVGKNVDINVDIMDYQWSSVDVFKFFGWQDQIVYKVGAEWRATDKLALRAGINYGKSPIQGDQLAANGALPAVVANYPFPAITEQHITIGMGYKMDKNMTINAYYLYAPKTTIQDTFSPIALSMSQNALGLGINYQTK